MSAVRKLRTSKDLIKLEKDLSEYISVFLKRISHPLFCFCHLYVKNDIKRSKILTDENVSRIQVVQTRHKISFYRN